MFGRVRVPLTSNLAECEVDPAAFEATQVYSPACLAATDSMVSCLTRFPELDTITSIRSDLIGWLSKVQVISRGESPLVTTHWTETRSPAFTGSSPNEIGAICGETASNQQHVRVQRVAYDRRSTSSARRINARKGGMGWQEGRCRWVISCDVCSNAVIS